MHHSSQYRMNLVKSLSTKQKFYKARCLSNIEHNLHKVVYERKKRTPLL